MKRELKFASECTGMSIKSERGKKLVFIVEEWVIKIGSATYFHFQSGACNKSPLLQT